MHGAKRLVRTGASTHKLECVEVVDHGSPVVVDEQLLWLHIKVNTANDLVQSLRPKSMRYRNEVECWLLDGALVCVCVFFFCVSC